MRSVSEEDLEVLVKRPSACSSCAARGACTTFGPSERVVKVRRQPDQPEAAPGDRVTLEIRSATFLRATMMGYLLPTIVFFAGVIAVMLLVPAGERLLGMARDLASFAVGALGVVLTFLGLWLVGSRSEARNRYAPRIISVSPATGAPQSR